MVCIILQTIAISVNILVPKILDWKYYVNHQLLVDDVCEATQKAETAWKTNIDRQITKHQTSNQLLKVFNEIVY